MKTYLSAALEAIRGFRLNSRGNIAVITAFMMLPLTLVMGMGVDYTLAKRRQDQISGYADAAALAAVTPTMMSQTPAAAQAAAQAMFNAQLATMTDISYSASNVTITATDVSTGTSVNRTVNISWSASSDNIFSGLLGVTTIPIQGTSQSTSSQAPKINFYLLLDTSPSMEIAATTAGMTTLINNTQGQVDPQTGDKGCAFGCHESDPAADALGNPGGEDNYALARALSVPLRIDLVNQATQNLMSLAQTTEAQNKTTYQAAIYTFDYNLTTIQALTSNLATAETAAANIAAVEVYKNNWLTSSNNNNDEDTYVDNFMANLYNTKNNGTSIMPIPGNGTSNPGDTPQEVLFIVSDGVNDNLVNGSRSYTPVNAATCTTIKNSGIRIAFLYLTYNPMPTNGWYNTYIAPIQSQIAPAAQSCASPGLYFEVNTGGDISAAMAALFQQAVATAHLSQ